LITRERHYVNGDWVRPHTTETIEVVDPATEQVIGSVPAGSPEDVDLAVAAARAAFDAWSLTESDLRAIALRRIAAELRKREDTLSDLITHELGCPRRTTQWLQVAFASQAFDAMADVLDTTVWTEEVDNFVVSREPFGVAGAITPWNYPLDQIAGKVAPALAAGCTVVLKPSEVTPLCAFVLAEAIDAVGLPAGVFNLVSGFGPVVGEAIAAHPDVDKVSFTGSTGAGRRVAELAAQGVKSLTLELGGKSANVILDDADLQTAVSHGVGGCFINSGQTCNAVTRMLVPRARLHEAEEIARRTAEDFTTGDPFDEHTQLGPLVSATQRDRVRGYIERGQQEGARLITGGVEPPTGLDVGYFVRPTVFSDVTPDMAIAQEEIFGPVLSILPYDSEAQALEVANGTVYGLVARVWSDDPERVERFARRLRAGQVYVNAAPFQPDAPFGGFKHSGVGREHGRYGLDEFLQTKATVRPVGFRPAARARGTSALQSTRA
jgi:acyl-CoA reductase-like NAD-dependent aldehyde dehydrogenase